MQDAGMMAKNIQQEAKSMEGPAGMTVTGGNPKFIFICFYWETVPKQ
jgi:hypothetical protein